MAYTITLTITRPNGNIPFGSPNPAVHDLQLVVQGARKIATGFLGETRTTEGNVQTIVRTWDTKENADAFFAVHETEINEIYALRAEYYTPNGVTISINEVQS